MGGDPTGVPMPPTLAASGTARAKPVRAARVGRLESTGSRTANIVAVVAVLDMNIDSTAVMSISASRAERALPLNGVRMRAARLRSRAYFAAPSAMRNPPRKRMITGSARLAHTSRADVAGSPSGTSACSLSMSTSSRMMTTAVATSGIASVTKSTIAMRKMPSIRSPGSSSPGTSTNSGTASASAARGSPRRRTSEAEGMAPA